jgi:hypothetical protein
MMASFGTLSFRSSPEGYVDINLKYAKLPIVYRRVFVDIDFDARLP